MTDAATSRPEGKPLVERFYELAKRGDWAAVLVGWRLAPAFARECAHYVKPTSGWTFAHQAAFDGSSAAVLALVACGANAAATGKSGETPAGVARERRHDAVATLLTTASESDHLWAPPRTAGFMPSSNRWDEARQRIATAPMTVQYAGVRVEVVPGDTYWVDSFERTLVGWHGTFSPPCGMDGDPMIATSDVARGE